MIIKKNILVKGAHGRPIVTDIFISENTVNAPIVIFSHGYKGFKDWGPWDLVARTFAKAGFCFLKFNFSHNGGTPEEPIDFPDLEAFGQNNFIKELDDLESVIDWISSPNFEFAKQINTRDLILIGHSRGGGIVTIKANEDRRVSQLVSWAGVSDYAVRFGSKEDIEKWKTEGIMYVQNGRTKQQMPHYYQFYENFLENETRLTIANAAQEIKKPHLIIHGDNDETVALDDAKTLKSWNAHAILEIIPGANHVFGGKHPWEENRLPDHLEEITRKTINFIKTNLVNSPSNTK